MKKVICIIIAITLLFTPTSIGYAKSNKAQGKNNHQTTQQHNHKNDDKKNHNYEDKKWDYWYEDKKWDFKNLEIKQDFKIDGLPVIKYGRYKLPISPITNGMGATVAYNKESAVLTVSKGTSTIVINFKAKTVTVNGVADTNSGIFTSSNSKKTVVLIKYIASKLGVFVSIDNDEVTVEVPGLNLPTKVTVTAVGNESITNTLNSTTLYLMATANITAGQATGGRAELYVDNKLVTTDTVITTEDTTVTFSTSDGTPTNSELQAIIPKGGVVNVKLYNANKNVVTSAVANPTLIVDYIAPTITRFDSAIYNVESSQLILNVIGAGAIGDKVDVTKISLYDYNLRRTYQLTNTAGTGSTGVVSSANSLLINIGSADKLGLTNFGITSGYLTVAIGSLLKDTAGNTSPSFTSIQSIPVIIGTGFNLPTNVTVTLFGDIVKANTLNSTTLSMTVNANITAGQATGGKAELYVGSKLVATDTFIASTDTAVSFTTSDYSPTNSELQAAVPVGGEVTVRLYNSSFNYVTSAVSNPTLVVDYVVPTITNVLSAVYNVTVNQLYLTCSGVGAVGDTVDVTKITLYAAALGKAYQLTNTSGTGSYGVVDSANTVIINIGSTDRLMLTGFGSTTVNMNININSLLRDAAGNTSTSYAVTQNIPVSVVY
jgi:hypothetical protein